MDLKSLIHRELGEGLTEKELASTVGVSRQTIADILDGEYPDDLATWEKFAAYFRMETDFLRVGMPGRSGTALGQARVRPVKAGRYRKVPLLHWNQIDQALSSKSLPREVRVGTMLETDVPGPRTFALSVKDNSMEPLFTEKEIIFVNPDLSCEPGHYVVVGNHDGRSEDALLRQLKRIGNQYVLHPLSRDYNDLPLTLRKRIKGRVVRLRKNL
ncbi:MAG: S24 family peptidase [Nitrospiraceae bacterium]